MIGKVSEEVGHLLALIVAVLIVFALSLTAAIMSHNGWVGMGIFIVLIVIVEHELL